MYLRPQTAAAALLLSLALPCMTMAQQRVVTSVEPATANQGDTLLLTIRGQSLPTGSVMVDFFPQQVAVIGIVGSTETELLVQVKVPQLATPGKYNLSVYNQLGDEAFGKELFTVISSVLTPVFRSYDPKSIAVAETGFAVLLSGESITEDAASHLTVDWYLGDTKVESLTSVFGYAGPGKVTCAVSGTPPMGTLKGRVFMDEIPIYQLELQIGQGIPSLIGHSPTSLALNSSPYRIRIIGSGLSLDYLTRLRIAISGGSVSAAATDTRLLDNASVEATFAGPLPEGSYSLSVSQEQAVLYEGELEITAALEQQLPPETLQDPLRPPETDTPSVTEIKEPEIAEMDAETQLSEFDIAELNAGTQLLTLSAPAEAVIPHGDQPFRFVVPMAPGDPPLAERLEASLELDGARSSVLMSGDGREGAFFVFAPVKESWPVGSRGKLLLHDIKGEYADFTALVRVDEAELQSDAVTPAQADTWAVQRVYMNTGRGGSLLTASIDPPLGERDLAKLVGTFTLAPADAEYQKLFGNLTLEGSLEFRQSDSGALIGTCEGNFVPGYLLVQVSYDGGAKMLSAHELECELPRAVIVPPDPASATAESGAAENELRWGVDFAPLIVANANLLTPRVTGDDTSFTVKAEGSRLAIRQSRTSLQYLPGTGEAVLALDSPAPLSWPEGQELRFLMAPPPVVLVEAPSLELQDLGPAIELDAAGFTVSITANSSEHTPSQWAAVTLGSSNLLLAASAKRFTVSATTEDGSGQSIIRLRFTRDAQQLNDIAYGLLVDELVAKGADLTLTWTELKATLTVAKPFIRVDVSDTADEVLELPQGG